MLLDQFCQVGCLSVVLTNHGRIFRSSMFFERHPYLQGFEASGEFKPVIIDRIQASRKAPLFLQEVIGGDGKRISVFFGVPNQGTAHFIGNIEPFVEIKCQTVCFFDCFQWGGVSRVKLGQSAIGSVHVKPKSVFFRNSQ